MIWIIWPCRSSARPTTYRCFASICATRCSDIHLIAKIEKAEALDQIDAIIEASDGLMIARGDLGVEMDVAQVPIIQKDLIRRCQTGGQTGDRRDADAAEHDRAGHAPRAPR